MPFLWVYGTDLDWVDGLRNLKKCHLGIFVAYRRSNVRAGEMIPEVGWTRPWGPSRKRVPKCLKGPKTTYITIAITRKQYKRSKKGPFSLCIGSPQSHPGNGINGSRRGRSLPVPPPSVPPAMSNVLQVARRLASCLVLEPLGALIG